jgi:hypothetical protein
VISFPVVDLACCCPRALTASGRQVVPGNDVYWHTREACLKIARFHGLTTPEFVRAISAANLLPIKEIWERSASFWPSVAHPDVLAREVMES